MTQTRTTADAVLKQFYLPPLRDILNNQTFLLSQIERTSERVEGREIVMAIRIGRNQGIGARAENAVLPSPGQQRYVNVRNGVKLNYGGFELTGPLMRAMASDKGSFTRPLESEMSGLVQDLKNDVNRQLFGDGTGSIVAISGSNTGAAVPIAGVTATQLRQLVPGMSVDIISAVNAVVEAAFTIVSATSTQVTLDRAPALATAAAQKFARSGAVGNEVTGLSKIIAATGAVFGLDPATEPQWKSYVNAAAGSVSEDDFIQAWQEVNLASGAEMDIWITTAGVHRAFNVLLQSLKRYTDPQTLKAGYTGLDMGAVGQGNTGGKTQTMVFDKDCPDSTAFGLTTDRFHWDRMSDWEFMDEDGAVLQRAIGAGGRRDAYEATLFCYADLQTHDRAAHAKLSGFTGATGFIAPMSADDEDEAKATAKGK